jgi:transcriptional regulator with XRE-family HTH domain
MIGGNQIRMARVGLRWTIDELANQSGVGVRTIKRLEAADQIASANVSTIERLRTTLEAAGIEFIGTPEDGPGVRIWRVDQG